MVIISHTIIAALKDKIQNVDTIETYAYFPEIITAGKYKLEVEEFKYLLENDYIKECRKDTCGKIYEITEKGKSFILKDL